MWKAFGNISANRPHLLKSIRNYLQNNKVIELPQTFAYTHNLSSFTVQCQHLVELSKIQENIKLQLTPQLESNDIIVGKFNKMKINKAKHVLSRNVSSALNFLAKEKNKKEYSTTAAFIKIVSKWFTLITSRS
ncbi:uncharacterized protein LOC113005683 [Solenopsis invicta]|uniref:uncharacterized protein LOC113005683 n=1 Tax=Solenopsis invicta TaxID=13686 RepID=UPI000E33E7C9|nr:uncharacterized protein LOC113005683 [Solenopsis invicta]